MDDTPKPLAHRLIAPPRGLDRERALRHFAEVTASSPALAALAAPGSATAAVLEAVFVGSPYLTQLILRDPAGTAADLERGPDAALAAILAGADCAAGEARTLTEVQSALRVAKARAARLIAIADIGGVWDVDRVIAALSEVAARLISAGVAWLLGEAVRAGALIAPADEALVARSGYIVLGMGKLGAGELNYSSDIDLIVLFDHSRTVLGNNVEPQRLFVRITKDLVKLLQERTADGYVYRTDLRLRPDPGATNVAISVPAAAQYYESAGQNWERAALIKARPIAGDIEAGEAFLDELSPFIWRKYLDFAAIADVHSIKRQIQAFRGHGEVAVAGHNIKLGRGGIREIEFFVQTQQLIAGGRQPHLRGRQTLAMLDELTEFDWIDRETRDELAAAYRFLRKVENRLQMVADEQTHTLPKDKAALDQFACFAGFADPEGFAGEMRRHLGTVEHHYSALFESAPGLAAETGSLVFTGGEDDPETLETLAAMGFADQKLVSRMVREWHHGRYQATRSATARERLTELVPALLQSFAETENPDQALLALDRFIAQLPAGVQLFSLLCANPHLLGLIADIMGTAPRLARILGQRPRTLDGVLDPEFFSLLPDQGEYASLAREALDGARDLEDALDRARALGQEQLFRIGVRILAGTATAEESGAAYSDLASGLISALLVAVEQDLARQHGHVPGGEVAVVGMGKLGSRELSATSDLDLILIYDAPADVPASDGPRPLDIGHYYTRFTQRLISALSVPTAEGRLYSVDMRLRPSGRSGPVATRMSAFREYQEQSAWTWEKMALTRARVIAGHPALCDRVTSTIRAIVAEPRDPAVTAKDVADMRARIEAEKGTDDIWSIKQVRGGLVDLEFIVQYLLLINAHRAPDVLHPNTAAAIGRLASAGLVNGGLAEELIAAYRLYHDITQMVRLCLGEPADPQAAAPGFKLRLAQAAGMPDFAVLEAELRETESRVLSHFKTVVEMPAAAATESAGSSV